MQASQTPLARLKHEILFAVRRGIVPVDVKSCAEACAFIAGSDHGRGFWGCLGAGFESLDPSLESAVRRIDSWLATGALQSSLRGVPNLAGDVVRLRVVARLASRCSGDERRA